MRSTVYKVLNCMKSSLISVCCCQWFCFNLCLVSVPIGIGNSAVGLKVCVITSGNKKHISMIKKKNHQIVLLVKTKLSTTEALLYKALVDSAIIKQEFF